MLHPIVRIGAVLAGAWLTALCAEAEATDFFRCLGIGYSAGYNAPTSTHCAPTAHKLPGWYGWRHACCQPGAAPKNNCGCGPQTCTPCGCGPMIGGPPLASPAIH
ncbi:MAG: hypothetical protein JNL96_20135 [Planctomycetaceae bacterium]|nr:hypothetical protein [Planctomycetaceae bacterium]